MKENSIPGWTINVDEVSNGVYKVTMTDAYGRKAEIIDSATDETIEKAISDAFDIEKQISTNWSLFLYNLAVQKLPITIITNREYYDKAFGSWIIEGQDKRLVYDGRDYWLVFQTKSNSDWTDIEIIKMDDIKYSTLVRQINMLTENNPHNNSSPNVAPSWWKKLFRFK
jgi:hypothetical protein